MHATNVPSPSTRKIDGESDSEAKSAVAASAAAAKGAKRRHVACSLPAFGAGSTAATPRIVAATNAALRAKTTADTRCKADHVSRSNATRGRRQPPRKSVA